MWFFYASLSALTAALVAIFAKAGLNRLDSITATTIRACIMALFLVMFTTITGKAAAFKLHAVTPREWTLLLLAGLSGALSWLFYFIALRQGNATAVAAIDRLSIVFVVILAALFLHETVTIRSISGALLMVTGALLISMPPNFFKNLGIVIGKVTGSH